MTLWAQIDTRNSTLLVTGLLQSEVMPAIVPKDRQFVQVPDDMVISLPSVWGGGLIFTPVPSIAAGPDPVQTKLDTVLTAVQAIQVKVGASLVPGVNTV